MDNINLELQEKIKKVAVKIIKHYRGRGPEYVKVNIDSPKVITVKIKGILSNLSEILVNEGALDIVVDYWKVMKPHLEKTYLEEVKDILEKNFTYDWEVCDIKSDDRIVVITINLID
ncbi:DUF2294 domain-containing protein [Clostridium sp. SHJSY1]|uniref:Na-translocating system protein MpsC family protein n=1 Tax=Clostridium sp. SHJSY1 TaxID=2942483 RepID=UPI00287635DB|nr:Na-translocating system protein MpsC family protein [Clostridium sp. SHJSY1]MDS0525853.1 DUF2294 domain-containing protein [Clostridium sp. SHJSY1]